jgi:hypothetical protein
LVVDGMVGGLEADELAEEGAQGLVRRGLGEQVAGALDDRFEQAGNGGVEEGVLPAEGADDGRGA